jgi:hypothetical protein
VALFYPFTLAACAAGFVAFLMLLLKFPMLTVSTIVLWFYFISAASIYLISKSALKSLGMHRLFLGFIVTIGTLAILSALLFFLEELKG